MRFLLRSALKDLRWRRRDPAALAIWVGIPLAIGLLFGLIAGSDAAAPKAHVLLVDEDDSFLSGLLGGASGGTAGQMLQLEAVETVTLARSRLEAGEATALLVIPKGFQDAVLKEQPATLTLVTNPAQRILPGVVEEGLEILLEGVFYAQRLLHEPLQDIAAQPDAGQFPSNADVASVSTAVNEALKAIQPVAFPPVIDLKFEQQASGAPAGGLARLFFPGLLVMSLLFVGQGMSDDVWTEKEQGVLRRVMSVPQPPAAFLGARVLAAAAFIALVSLTGLGLGALIFDIPPARLPLATLWCVFTGCALLVFFTFIQLLGGSRRGAGLLALMLVFPLMMIGGSMFPMEMMPAWMARIGSLTPNGQAVVQLKAILYGTPDWQGVGVATLAIALPAAAAFVISARRLRAFAGR